MVSTGSGRTRGTAVLALAVALLLAPTARAQPEPGPAEAGRTAPPGFVSLHAVAPSIRQDIRYFTRHNFTGERVDGYRAPVCLLTADAAHALQRAQQGFLRRGYTLKVYDCYRPQRAVDHFVRWAADPADARMRREFFPEVDKSRLFEDGYLMAKSGHSRGSTVDLTLVPLPAPPARPYLPGEPLVSCFAPHGKRFPDDSVDMGTGYDCFDPRAHTLDPRVRGEPRAHRLLLRRGLARAGFVNYPHEWWHYTYQPETFPHTYFDFPVEVPRFPRR